jgi:mono/diheme cytochrome c family protein
MVYIFGGIIGGRRTRRRARGWTGALALAAFGVGCDKPEPDAPLPATIDYVRDIQPILSARCVACHGPDESTRGAGLRLDTFEGATAVTSSGHHAIVPRDPDHSYILNRVTATGNRQMPPAPRPALTSREVALIRGWIAGGATYSRHWSLERPVRPVVPSGATNPVDAFVNAALVQRGVTPSPPAAPEVLVRRLFLDLTGLPPTPAEVDAFIADPSETAYQALVNRLIGSDAYAEHLTRDWMDFAGYGDTNAAYVDDERHSWPWRDWVLASFKDNRHLDEFILRQLAGDMLPGATEDDVLATGFLRMHPTTSEGGIDPDQWRFQHSMDRAHLVGTQFLGLTVQCAQCHDHKYDPIAQVDFYSLIACFDRVADRGFVQLPAEEAPTLTTAGPVVRVRQAALNAQSQTLTAALTAPAVADAQTRWESTVRGATVHWNALQDPSVRSLVGNPVALDASGRAVPSGAAPAVQGTAFTLRGEHTIRALRLFVGASLPDGGGPVITEVTADLETAHRRQRVRFALAYTTNESNDAWRVIDGNNRTGVGFSAPGWVVLVPTTPIAAEGATLTVQVEERWGQRTVASSLALDVTADEASVLSPALLDALQLAKSERTAEQRMAVTRSFAAAGQSSPARDAARALFDVEVETDRLRPVVTRVMREDDTGRHTNVMRRGVWGQRGVEVHCAAPTALTLDGLSQPVNDRLSLARWVVSAESPTTARIMANRYVQRIFGRGLLPTPDDLGVRGARATNPELLDWLAVDLRESGWDLQAFIRRLVLSETYRRSSAERADLAMSDPDNTLLARAHRVRLDAEVLRDQASFASGLQVADRMGGPPVFPYHPDGVYEAINDAVGDLTTYRADRDVRSIHRRALYVFWRRSTMLPSLALMDAPVRFYGIARRDETNTPTQALATLNEPFFVESARTLAERARTEAPADVDGQIGRVIRHVLGRPARADEVAAARQAYDAELAELQGTTAASRVLAIGEASFDAAGDAAAEAALTLVARAVLSSTEALTRE